MSGGELAPSPFGSLVGFELNFWRDGEAEVHLPFRDGDPDARVTLSPASPTTG